MDVYFICLGSILLSTIIAYSFLRCPKLKEKIKIIGIGGGGSNIVEYLSTSSPEVYSSLAINSDKKALDIKNVDKKILLKKDNFYGCGSNIMCGYSLVTPKVIREIKKFITKKEEAYIFVTLGGGCGTGSLRAIVQEFKDSTFLLNFILITPFKWEGEKKRKRANDAIEEIKKYYKNVTIFSNDDLLNLGNLGISECFKIQNEQFKKLTFKKDI